MADACEPRARRRVLVTRPAEQADGLCRLIEEAGGEALRFPAIRIVAVDDPGPARAALARIAEFDPVIFISRNAVEYAERLAPGAASRAASLGRRVLAVGEGTVTALATAGVAGAVAPDHGSGSEALLDLPELAPSRLSGRDVLIVRGRGGREFLREVLERRGAHVHYAEVYGRACPPSDDAAAARIWQADRPDVIVVTSAEAAGNLVALTPPRWRGALMQTPLVVMSERIREAALQLGFAAPVTVAGGGERGLVAAIELRERESGNE